MKNELPSLAPADIHIGLMSFAAIKEIDCRNNSELALRAGVIHLKYWDGLNGEENPSDVLHKADS